MKNAQDSKNSSTNWKIESKLIDTYEISPTDTQHEYLVYVKDGANQSIEARTAFGIAHRTEVTKELLSKYGAYVDKIEHEE
tara:strand:+ start:580 stop:822 length:243 start_codon:yes stop_codon:yes gene_type:complete